MKVGALLSLVGQNVRRSKKNLLMSCFGIVVGISTFVFFIGLSEGVKSVVLGEVFIIDQVELVPKTFDTGFGQFGGGRVIDDTVANEFRAMASVKAVFPKMKFTFPTGGRGGRAFLKRDIRMELIGDGLSSTLIGSELAAPETFRDFDADRAQVSGICSGVKPCKSGKCHEGQCRATCGETSPCPQGLACMEGLCTFQCGPNKACLDGRQCTDGACVRQSCEYTQATRLSACPGDSYCARDTKRCETPIPVVVNHHLLEIYNGGLGKALSTKGGKSKLPKLSKSMVQGFQLDASFGRSFLGRGKANRKNALWRRIKLVGLSHKAINLGITIPLEYVQRFNTRFSGEEAAMTYHSMIIQVADQTQVPQIVAAVKKQGFALAESTTKAEQASKIIQTVESVFALISFIIVGIAAVNISQMFFMLILQRRRELGLFRAVGGSRNDVRLIILGEASLIGLLGGTIGAAVGYGAAHLVDTLAKRAPEFPYKPETFFYFPWWIWPCAIAIAVFFCLLGAFFPANTAARQEPASALTD